jgi:hypothetical protein
MIKFYCFSPNNYPPEIPEINGPSTGKSGESYNYKFKSKDHEEDDVSYYIRWGDVSITDWATYQDLPGFWSPRVR